MALESDFWSTVFLIESAMAELSFWPVGDYGIWIDILDFVIGVVVLDSCRAAGFPYLALF